MDIVQVAFVGISRYRVVIVGDLVYRVAEWRRGISRAKKISMACVAHSYLVNGIKNTLFFNKQEKKQFNQKIK